MAVARVRHLRDLPPDEMEFRLLSGRPSLDLTATVGERWNRAFERLLEPADLDRWLAAEGLGARGASPATAEELRAARRLREAVYRAALARADATAPRPADERVINEFAALPPLAPAIRGATVGWRAADPVPAALSTVARDAIDLLTGPQRGRIRECASATCALLFVDASRPGQRRWCSSERCGGAARAVAYRERLRSTH